MWNPKHEKRRDGMFIQLERHFGLYQPGGKGRESRETLAAKKKPTAERRRGFFPKEAGIWRIYPRQRSAQALTRQSNQRFPPQPAERAENNAGIQGIFRTHRD